MSAQATALRGAVKAADDDVGDWLKGLVTGEGSNPSQVIVSGVLSVIPGLGQAMDLRDIVLGVIVISKSPASPMAWLDISITLVGCIPVMGDGLKAGFRLMKGGASLPRILDAVSPALKGNLEKWFRGIDWAHIAGSVKGSFDEIMAAFIDGLDSWLVKSALGRKEVDFLIAQMKDMRARAPKMLDEAIEELKVLWRKAMGDSLPKSTAVQSSAHASALPATRGEGAAKPGKAGKSEHLERDHTGTETTTPDKPRSNERRAAKKKRKWETGVPAEHIADYWVARNKRNLKKANNGGRLWEEWDRAGRQGIDHVWMNRGEPVRPGVVAETKSTLFGAFRFLAALPGEIRTQLNALGDAEAASPTSGGQPDIFKSDGRDGVDPGRVRVEDDEQNKNERVLKKGLGKANPDTGLKTQMSHAWIQKAIQGENLTAAGAELRRQIEAFRKRYALGEDAGVPYARWIIMVTGRQKHLHENKQGHRHEIQKPLILLPDSILME